MTTMKERLARAIYLEVAPTGAIWEAVDPRYKESVWKPKAEAVLREMLDGLPLEVKLAGAKAITLEHMKARANYDAFCDAWQAAIQAAIDE